MAKSKESEQQIAAKFTKAMVMLCIRNTYLEDLHAGRSPKTHTGDYSDVKVVDAEGNEIPWAEVSRFDDDEMKKLMKQIINRIYTFNLNAEDPDLHRLADKWASAMAQWDEPELDEFYKRKNPDWSAC